MEISRIIERLDDKFLPDIINTEVRNEKRVTVSIKPEQLAKIALYLYKTERLRFIIASALHTKKGFEIYYHFSKDETGLIMNLHVILNKENPSIESLSNMFNASNWIEREMHELFGINFIGHPNQEKLISEGNWAEGVYPYRKEFK